MRLGLFAGKVHADDEVGRVSGGGEDAPPLAGLVDRGEVAGGLREVAPLAWLHPDLQQYRMCRHGRTKERDKTDTKAGKRGSTRRRNAH